MDLPGLGAEQYDFEVEIESLDQCYKVFLSSIASDQKFVNASYENKILLLVEFFSSGAIEFRLGSLIFLFELIYNFRDSLTENAIAVILKRIYENVPSAYESKDFYSVFCSLEIVALIGPHPISYENIKLLVAILIDEAIPVLQDKAFLALVNFDYPGLHALLDIANKDFNEVPLYIMNRLAETEELQLSVIIPSLLNDINSQDIRKRTQSLAALNRMYSLIWKGRSLPVLVQILNEGQIDRQLVVSTIRACGEIGEQTLLKILRTTNNYKIKLAISTVLSWRVPKDPRSRLPIRIVPFQVALHYNVNPGTMCLYRGDLTPLAYLEQESLALNQEGSEQQREPEEGAEAYSATERQAPSRSSRRQSEDFIEINSRDFMAALQRLLAVKLDKFQNSADGFTRSHDISPHRHQFTLIRLIDPSSSSEVPGKDPEGSAPISDQVLRALCALTQDENVQVREAAINTIGIIGLPEAF